MQKTALMFLIAFLFLAAPALAYTAVDLNVTTSFAGGNSKYIRCTNSTVDNGIYCYIFRDGLTAGNTYITRFNSTLGNESSCPINTSYLYSSKDIAVLNESYALLAYGTAKCDLWNISTIGAGVCVMVESTDNSDCDTFLTNNAYAVTGNDIYVGEGSIILDKNNLSSYTAGYWPNSFEWGGGVHFTATSYIPDSSDATTAYFTTVYAGSSGDYALSPIYKYVGGVLYDVMPSIADIYGITSTYNSTFFDIVKNGAGNGWVFMYNRDLGRVYRANFSLTSNYTEPCENVTGYDSGTNCVSLALDPTRRMFVTNNDSCHLTYGSCSSGTMCVAYTSITPALNTTPAFLINTVACLNLTTGHILTDCIDQNGNSIACSDITTTNSSYEVTCTNTSVACYDSNCNLMNCYGGADAVQGARNWSNSMMGTPFGADIVALICASAIAIWAFMLSSDKKIEVLFGTFLLVAGAFSFVGFLTYWFLVLEGACIFVMIFWKTKAGG